MMNEFNPDGKDIRFIDSHYRDLFRIPDGGTIQVHYSDDSVVIKPCKFIDEYHTQIGNVKEKSRTLTIMMWFMWLRSPLILTRLPCWKGCTQSLMWSVQRISGGTACPSATSWH